MRNQINMYLDDIEITAVFLPTSNQEVWGNLKEILLSEYIKFNFDSNAKKIDNLTEI